LGPGGGPVNPWGERGGGGGGGGGPLGGGGGLETRALRGGGGGGDGGVNRRGSQIVHRGFFAGGLVGTLPNLNWALPERAHKGGTSPKRGGGGTGGQKRGGKIYLLFLFPPPCISYVFCLFFVGRRRSSFAGCFGPRGGLGGPGFFLGTGGEAKKLSRFSKYHGGKSSHRGGHQGGLRHTG